MVSHMIHYGHHDHLRTRAFRLAVSTLVLAGALVLGLHDVAGAGLEWRDMAQLQTAEEPSTAYELGRWVARLLLPGLVVFFVVRAVRHSSRRQGADVDRTVPTFD